jgi:hypothetical protein
MARNTIARPRLKLVNDGAPMHIGGPTSNPYKFERRQEPRVEADGAILASYRSPGRFGITTLTVVDRSATGVGATSDVEVEPGMRVMLAGDTGSTAWLPGVVVRCEAIKGRYRVGIRLDRRSHAA